MIESNDPGASAAAIKKFGALAKRSGQPVKAVGGGFQIQVQGAPGPVSVVARGNKVVIAYGKGTVDKALNPSGKLSSSQAYKDASAALGGGKPSFLVSVPAVLQLAQSTGQTDSDFRRAKPYLEAFTSLAGGTTESGGNKLGKVAVGLK